MSAFIWPILALPMGVSLLMRKRKVRAPKGFTIWLIFLAWLVGSSTQLSQLTRVITYAYRGSLYLSATVVFLFVYNASEAELPTASALRTMSLFWLFVVFGGFLGIADPHGGFSTIMQHLMPHRFLSNDWVLQLVHPSFAQVQDFLGFPVGRPTAPFVYTNEWGSNMGLLIPLVVASWSFIRKESWVLLTGVALILSVIPIVASLNRGLWLSLTVGMFYASWRFALKGRSKAFGGVLVAFAVIGVLVVTTPLGALVSDRFQHGHSNAARASLDVQAVAGVTQSPWFGFGSPLPSSATPGLPNVGTQGQLWLVLYSQGFPGMFAFLGWFAFAFWATRQGGTRARFWGHVMLLIMLVQLPFYGMLPSSLHVVMVGAALAFREPKLFRESKRSRAEPPVPVAA